MPKGVYDRATSRWQPRFASDPPELVEAVRRAYDSGLSMREVANEVGVSVKMLQRLMPRHGIRRRRAVVRDQFGERNPRWKGEDAGYAALHDRVYRRRGKASDYLCACGTPAREWANLTGNYADPDDYRAMCASCHRTFDNQRRA